MRERINYIDYTKGIAILFVIFGHVYCGHNVATNWIYSFHIPLFFIVSGFLLNFSKSKDTKKIILKKLKLLMVPYLLFSLINIVGNYLINGLSTIVLKSDVFNTITLFGIGALWFLPVLFIVELIFLFNKNIINKNINKILFYLSIITIISVFILISKGNYNTIIGKFTVVFVRVVVAIFFSNIGYYSYRFINKINLKAYQIITLTLVSIGFSSLNGHVDLWGIQFNNIFLYVFNSITGSLTIIFMMKKVNRSKVLDFLGQNTLIIMATHQLIIKFILESSLGIKLNKFIILCLVLAIEYPIIKIINRYLPFMLGKKRIKTIKNEKLNTSIG